MTNFQKIKKILDADQKDRTKLIKEKLYKNRNFIEQLEKKDKKRIKEAKEILKESKFKKEILSKRTLYYIGVILQHSLDISDQKLGAELAKESIKLGSKEAHKLYRAAVDRILIQKTSFQKYGTHYKLENSKKILFPKIKKFSKEYVDKIIKID